MRILIAANPGPFTDVLKDVLRRSDLVHICHTGQDAIAAIHQFRPDMLLLQISLPDMNGLAVLRNVTNKPRFTIGFTNIISEIVMQEAAAAGINELFLLPVCIPYLLDRLDTYRSLVEKTLSQKS